MNNETTNYKDNNCYEGSLEPNDFCRTDLDDSIIQKSSEDSKEQKESTFIAPSLPPGASGEDRAPIAAQIAGGCFIENELAFPNEIITGAAGDFAKTYSKYMESPIEFFYNAFLTCLGSALTGKVTLDTEINPQPRLYTLILGESADTRKSTAITKTTEIFKEALGEQYHTLPNINSAEGLQRHLKKIKESPLLLEIDEFKTLVNKCSIKNSTLLPMLTSLFEKNTDGTMTKELSLLLTNAHLSILAACTSDTFDKMWGQTGGQFVDIGFINRLWLVPGISEKKYSLPKKVDPQEKQNIISNIREITIIDKKITLPITQEARDLFQTWYMNLEQSSIHTKRLDTYGARLMILLTINDRKKEVDIDTTNKIIKLLNWQLKVRRAHDTIDAETKAGAMEQRIRRALIKEQGLTNAQLKKKTNAHRMGLWFFNNALENLKKEKEIIAKGKKNYLIQEK